MASLYDNGSSLGCNIDQVGLDRVFDDHGNVLDSHLEKQPKKGVTMYERKSNASTALTSKKFAENFLNATPRARSGLKKQRKRISMPSMNLWT